MIRETPPVMGICIIRADFAAAATTMQRASERTLEFGECQAQPHEARDVRMPPQHGRRRATEFSIQEPKMSCIMKTSDWGPNTHAARRGDWIESGGNSTSNDSGGRRRTRRGRALERQQPFKCRPPSALLASCAGLHRGPARNWFPVIISRVWRDILIGELLAASAPK